MSIIVWNTSSVGRIPSPRAKGTTITKILNRGRSKRSRRLSPPPFPAGQTAGDYDTIAKLTRVTMLAPVVMALRIIAARTRTRDAAGANRKSVPKSCFVLGFILLVAVHSLVVIPTAPMPGS